MHLSINKSSPCPTLCSMLDQTVSTSPFPTLLTLLLLVLSTTHDSFLGPKYEGSDIIFQSSFLGTQAKAFSISMERANSSHPHFRLFFMTFFITNTGSDVLLPGLNPYYYFPILLSTSVQTLFSFMLLNSFPQ